MQSVEFNKYRLYGDYHWKEFRRQSAYRRHALHVQLWVKEQTGLDVGCGDGLITHLLGVGWSGIDIDPLAVKFAIAHGVNAVRASVYDLNYVNSFEAVYCGDVIEHLEQPERALNAIATMTSTLYLATPPRHGKSLRPYHVREWNKEELIKLMADLNWKCDEFHIEPANDRMYGKFITSGSR